jgi:uncharacterized protein
VPAPEETEASLAVRLEHLDRAECIRLLASVSVGRLGLLVDGRPEILPVTYAVDDETVVFRTAEGTVLNQAAMQVVAFEADQVDEATHAGWSVLVQGVAQDVSDALDTRSERLRAVALVTWAPGQRHRWFRLDAHRVTGRRLLVGDTPATH